MRSIGDDHPQFVEVTGDALTEAAAEYRRIWGEDMPTPDEPNTEPGPDERE